MNKKNLILTIIVIEILVILIIITGSISGWFVKYNPIFEGIPTGSIVFQNTSSIFDIFSNNSYSDLYLTNTPNYFWNMNNSFSGYTEYFTNSEGLRATHDYSIEKPNDVFRIAVIGDSYTYGLYVNISDTYSEVLENKLSALNCSKKIEVINFGAGGADFPDEVNIFNENARYYGANVYIITVKNDDINLINKYWFPIYEKYDKQYNSPHIFTSEGFVKYQEFIKKAAAEYFSKYDVNSKSWINENINKPLITLQKVNANNAKIVIFTFGISDNYNGAIESETRKQNFNFLTLNYTGFWNYWDKNLSVIPEVDNHPNKAGHLFLADFLYKYIISNKMINC